VENCEADVITEIALFDLKPGKEREFEAGIKTAIPLFKRAKGLKEFRVNRSIEKPNRYRLLITWETVESHTIDFRGSEDYQEFRKLVSHCYAAPPDVEHVQEIAGGF
jgi:heme-degrading monooxygenase HmoA